MADAPGPEHWRVVSTARRLYLVRVGTPEVRPVELSDGFLEFGYVASPWLQKHAVNTTVFGMPMQDKLLR